METIDIAINEENQQIAANPIPFARGYQLEALEIAVRQNTIVFFETGTGKTLIATMLLRSYAHLFRKPLPYIAVFLVPTVVLVNQQGKSVKTHTDLEVGKYSSGKRVDFRDAATWKTDKHEVLVMTSQILLDALRRRLIRLDQIKVLIFDECHIARGKSAYACIMTEFYHPELECGSRMLPRVFGMTASPIKAKASNSTDTYWKKISDLENLMHSKVFTCHSDCSTSKLKVYDHEDLPHETFNSLESSLQELVEKDVNPKQLACLEDNLVPDIVEEETGEQQYGCEPYVSERARYIPRELVGTHANESDMDYHFYLIELQQKFDYDVKPQGILLAIHERLDNDLESFNFDMDVGKGKLIVNIKEVGHVTLSPEQVVFAQKFQVTLLQVLLKQNLDKADQRSGRSSSTVFNYLFLPCLLASNGEILVDWKCIFSVLYENNASLDRHTDSCVRKGPARMHTKDGPVCYCMLENSLVCTPHTGVMYCIRGALEGVNGNSCLNLRDGDRVSYKKYYKQRHGIDLQFASQTFLSGKHIFTLHNYLQRCRSPSTKEPSNSSCELPPELCSIIMSPISVSLIYSFTFLPCIMHRFESLLLASNLRSVPSGQKVVIPTLKVLEAITTEECQENIHLESLETLGDSFLKYATSQQLFKTYQNQHEGRLSLKRERIICNAALCKFGCDRQIPGFIRNEPFDLKTWMIPGYDVLEDAQLSSCKKVYTGGKTRNIKSKTVADVVEALIGAYLSAGGEIAALSFMAWLGINVDFARVPCAKTFIEKPEKYVNVRSLESLLKYKFQDASLLVEALTHGSYMRPEIPHCYQRLEFLGDAVLDYLITVHLYHTYHGLLSPGLLTDLRSASVNNDCYAQSTIRAGLHKHILHLSPDLQRHIGEILSKVDGLQALETFGWESETTFPKVLGDVIESIAGAVYIDSGCDKDRVFQSMKPLLEPLVTLETLKLHPKRELYQLCQKMQYNIKKPVVSRENGMANVTVEVEARGLLHKETRSASDRKIAEKLSCMAVLKSLKERM